IRYWVASVDYSNDAPCGPVILKQCGDQYRTVRNQLRFMLGNLKGFDPAWDGPLLDIDRWIIEQTELLVADTMDAYNRYEFGQVISGIHNFCSKQISAIYNDAIKDRMYCDGADWPTRRSGQKACHFVLLTLTKLLAPILPHTAEEVYERMPVSPRLASVHMETQLPPTAERLAEIEANDLQARVAELLAIREEVFAEFEPYKAQQGIKDSQKYSVTLKLQDQPASVLRSFGAELPNLFKMSEVTIVPGDGVAEFALSHHKECARSRLLRADVAEVTYQGEQVLLTHRDRLALGIE
ncbi:MAG: class I tRNA ligase family protein, partial [Armatimonadetes bacterium]|nr:class I tRNA ligase family protein [Armatimonadota bacterium]